MDCRFVFLCLACLFLVLPAWAERAKTNLDFATGDFTGWTVEGDNTWHIGLNAEQFSNADDPEQYVVNSLDGGEQNTGVLRSSMFTITAPFQQFSIAGWDGTDSGQNNGSNNYVFLKSHPDGEVLRRAHTPGGNKLAPVRWTTVDLMGRDVYLEVVDAHTGGGFAWIAFAGYKQLESNYLEPVKRSDLSAVRIDAGAETTVIRSMPFLAALPERRGETRRVREADTEVIPIDAQADAVYLSGLINEGWDYGVAHWGEHPELRTKREDQVYIGREIGWLEFRYEDGTVDEIPITIGATAWHVIGWGYGPTHSYGGRIQEPFASRPELMKVFRQSLRLREADIPGSTESRHIHYYLPVKPRTKRIAAIAVRNNAAVRGFPLVSGITLAGAEAADHLAPFPEMTVDQDDLEPRVSAAKAVDWNKDLRALSEVLYMDVSDLPERVDLLAFDEDLDVAQIRFKGGVKADMLTNTWTQNMELMADKFSPETGVFTESAVNGPWYGGYNGIGTWGPVGVYYGADAAFGRCSDHYATLVLRAIHNEQRVSSFVDYVDKYLYLMRPNHDPAKGPANDALDISRYPDDAPPHWSFMITNPLGIPWPIDPLPGAQETDGHGATIVGRWVAWRQMGAPAGDWLTAPREDVYGYSRWDSTHDAAEFICWYMDWTGMDVMFCEGETTGWGGHGALYPMGMHEETDPAKIRKNYANSNMYEPYPTWVCLTALRCSAQMADAVGKTQDAARWRTYADRLETGMRRQLTVGDHNFPMWRVASHSTYPSLQDSLVHAWFAIYRDGLDPQRWNPDFTRITRNSLGRQLDQPYGHAPVLAMGYGQGWLTKSVLLLDEMDDAGPMVWNIAKYSYDKNMDYVDEERGIDWRRWLYIIPEGTNILPDGRWHRIGDLSNGANQGPPMHALWVCAGVDYSDPTDLRIMPRAVDFMDGIEVDNFFALVPGDSGLEKARLHYDYDKNRRFELKSDRVLPKVSVRLGPFTNEDMARAAVESGAFPEGSTQRVAQSGHINGGPAWWLWVEDIAGMKEFHIQL